MKGDGSKPIPTRFPEPEIARMDAAAAASGLGTRATLIKFCLKMFLDDFEARGMRALPRDWREILEALDNRTRASAAAHVRESLVAEHRPAYGNAKTHRRKT